MSTAYNIFLEFYTAIFGSPQQISFSKNLKTRVSTFHFTKTYCCILLKPHDCYCVLLQVSLSSSSFIVFFNFHCLLQFRILSSCSTHAQTATVSYSSSLFFFFKFLLTYARCITVQPFAILREIF